jgi:defect in organelle trafficking protein DotD
MKQLFIVLLLSGLITGCVRPRFKIESNPQATAEAINKRLVEATASVSHSLNELTAMEKHQYPFKSLPYPTNYGLNQLVSVNWSGPIEPLLVMIAKEIGFELKVIGVSPAVPVLVTLTEESVQLNQVIYNADAQAGNKARIAVYPAICVIELRYGQL